MSWFPRITIAVEELKLFGYVWKGTLMRILWFPSICCKGEGQRIKPEKVLPKFSSYEPLCGCGILQPAMWLITARVDIIKWCQDLRRPSSNNGGMVGTTADVRFALFAWLFWCVFVVPCLFMFPGNTCSDFPPFRIAVNRWNSAQPGR